MMRFVTALAALAVLFTSQAHAESTLQTVLKRKQFIAGIVANPPPSAYVDAQGHTQAFLGKILSHV
jgi:hypothetical protein